MRKILQASLTLALSLVCPAAGQPGVVQIGPPQVEQTPGVPTPVPSPPTTPIPSPPTTPTLTPEVQNPSQPAPPGADIQAEPALTEEMHETAEHLNMGWKINFDLRTLPENWNFFPVPGRESDYGFLGMRSRLGALYQGHHWQARCELQDVQLFALPTGAVAPPPQGSLGQGGSYFSQGGATDFNSLGLRKLYLRFGELDETSFQVGRFNYYSGMETPSKDPILDWLKKERVSKKLIGCPDYNTWSRTFDGARLDVNSEPVHLTAAVLRPNEISPHFSSPVSSVLVTNLACTLKEEALIPNGEVQFFFNRYSDNRAVPQVDNFPVKRTILGDGGNLIDTVGFHYVTRIGRDGDFLLWAAHQNGQWGHLAHSANAFSVEAGLRFPDLPWKPWLRCGFSLYGGDSNPRDGQHNTFMAAVPDSRARFPLDTLANLYSPKLQLMLRPRKDTKVRLDFQWLRLDSAQDLWYLGSGVSQESGTNGYTGRPSGGSKDLGRLLELWVEHKVNENQKIVLHYGRAWGGDVVKKNFPGGATGQVILLEYHFTLP